MIKDLVFDISTRADEYDVLEEDSLTTQMIQDLSDTLEELNKTSGQVFLTSNQIGYNKRAFAIKFVDEIKFFFNPMIIKRSDVVLSRERDYTNGKEYLVPRYKEVILNYQNSLGAPKANKFTDEASIVVGMAVDLLDGVLTSDWGLELIPEFDQAPKEEQQEVIDRYIKSLTEFRDKLDEDLSNGEDQEKYKAIKFMKGVSDGSIQLDRPKEPKLNRSQRRSLSRLIKKITAKKKGKK